MLMAPTHGTGCGSFFRSRRGEQASAKTHALGSALASCKQMNRTPWHPRMGAMGLLHGQRLPHGLANAPEMREYAHVGGFPTPGCTIGRLHMS